MITELTDGVIDLGVDLAAAAGVQAGGGWHQVTYCIKLDEDGADMTNLMIFPIRPNHHDRFGVTEET